MSETNSYAEEEVVAASFPVLVLVLTDWPVATALLFLEEVLVPRHLRDLAQICFGFEECFLG